jgi:hypothetical protein
MTAHQTVEQLGDFDGVGLRAKLLILLEVNLVWLISEEFVLPLSSANIVCHANDGHQTNPSFDRQTFAKQMSRGRAILIRRIPRD